MDRQNDRQLDMHLDEQTRRKAEQIDRFIDIKTCIKKGY